MPLETGQDYYNYYSGMMPWGNQGTTAPGTGITQLATPGIKYPPNLYQTPSNDGPQTTSPPMNWNEYAQIQSDYYNRPRADNWLTQGLGNLKNKAMSIGPISAIVGATDKFSTLPQLDQDFINLNMGYRDYDQSGLSKDAYGINTRSLRGNYADYVREEAERRANLPEGFYKTQYQKDKSSYYKNQMAALQQLEQIKEQNRKAAIAQEQALARSAPQRGGGAGDSSPSHMGGISQSQADAVGAANKAAGMSGWGLARGGIIGAF